MILALLKIILIICSSFPSIQLEDGSLLSLFYYCDIAVNHQMHELNDLMRSNPDNLDRRYITTYTHSVTSDKGTFEKSRTASLERTKMILFHSNNAVILQGRF